MTYLQRELRRLAVRTTNWGRLTIISISMTAASPEPAAPATTPPPRLIYDRAA